MRNRIIEKIEEIRQKPEHVRVWYAWTAVLVVMFFVIIIWIFTLQENLRGSSPVEDVKKIQERIPSTDMEQQKQSLEEIFKKEPSPSGSSEYR